MEISYCNREVRGIWCMPCARMVDVLILELSPQSSVCSKQHVPHPTLLQRTCIGEATHEQGAFSSCRSGSIVSTGHACLKEKGPRPWPSKDLDCRERARPGWQNTRYEQHPTAPATFTPHSARKWVRYSKFCGVPGTKFIEL